MAQTFDKIPVIALAEGVPGPERGCWTYDDYAALPDEGKRYEIVISKTSKRGIKCRASSSMEKGSAFDDSSIREFH
ncbi:MAG TPA: hypothetical protein VKV20_10020 [Ktedonobacteraceae bacterium]|nr:hypothetical protein [Ktedonobacteraceae bacterium]